MNILYPCYKFNIYVHTVDVNLHSFLMAVNDMIRLAIMKYIPKLYLQRCITFNHEEGKPPRFNVTFSCKLRSFKILHEYIQELETGGKWSVAHYIPLQLS